MQRCRAQKVRGNARGVGRSEGKCVRGGGGGVVVLMAVMMVMEDGDVGVGDG